MLSRFLALILLLMVVDAARAEFFLIDVPAGDLAALQQAIVDANGRPAGDGTTIDIRGEFVFSPDDTLPPIERSVSIRGGWSARFRAADRGPHSLILVSEGGHLGLNDIELSGFQPDALKPQPGVQGLIEVRGELSLDRVQFNSSYYVNACASRALCSAPLAVLFNHASGRIDMDKVSFIDSGTSIMNFSPEAGGLLENHGAVTVTNTQLMLSKILGGWVTPIANEGDLQVLNSSFLYRSADRTPPAAVELVYTAEGAQTAFANSVIGGFSGHWCGQAASLGHNLVDAPECGWAAEGDLTGASTGLVWRPVESLWPALTHALVPSAASAAVDSADPAFCPPFSLTSERRLPNDGNGDGAIGCDRGATELAPIGLAEGGINGFYYDPGDDGHYVYIQETDFTTLVMWNTFDRDGNPAWVYGLGDLVNGRSVIADAYVNRSGGFSPDGIVTDVEAQYWGRLEVDMVSCLQGTVAYFSEQPGFGSGQFPIERLAFVKQLGCIDN